MRLRRTITGSSNQSNFLSKRSKHLPSSPTRECGKGFPESHCTPSYIEAVLKLYLTFHFSNIMKPSAYWCNWPDFWAVSNHQQRKEKDMFLYFAVAPRGRPIRRIPSAWIRWLRRKRRSTAPRLAHSRLCVPHTVISHSSIQQKSRGAVSHFETVYNEIPCHAIYMYRKENRLDCSRRTRIAPCTPWPAPLSPGGTPSNRTATPGTAVASGAVAGTTTVSSSDSFSQQ